MLLFPSVMKLGVPPTVNNFLYDFRIQKIMRKANSILPISFNLVWFTTIQI